MKRLQILAAGPVLLALAVGPAGASIVTVTGPASSLGAFPAIIAAPSAVLDEGVTNLGQQGFNERQSVVLTSAIATDQGVIAAGTVVNSHMIFFNKPTSIAGTDSHIDVIWTFDGTILGTMSDSPGTLEEASNSQLGSPTTTYPGAFAARGLEGADDLTITGNQLNVDLDMFVAQPGDWIRVVTAVPEPGTLGLLGLGLVGLGAIIRRRKV